VGGHSGVDIDKGIPSAIKVLGEYLHEHQITQLASLYAGERRNSIPANAVAIVRTESKLENTELVKVRELTERPKVLSEGAKTIEMIHSFKHGVHAQNEELGIPDVSINLAIITADEKGGLLVETSARAMDAVNLEKISQETLVFFNAYGFTVKLEDKYPAWKPDISDFTNLVSQEVQAVFGKTKMMAIHAGLECGVIAEKYPAMKFASIGPTIRYPHSTREMVHLESVERTFEVVKQIIRSVNEE
jgi:dipeptidase D